MIRRSMGSRSLAALLLVMTAFPAEAEQDDGPYRLGTLTVTANKREQELDKVDGTVTVRTAEELEAAQVTKVEELDRVFPGLIIRNRGNRAYANITLRGVTSSDFYNPAVQIYVDGVPQDPAYFTQELANVERVELLHGPQGTLYGRNAHGGVINIITRKPGNAFGGNIGAIVATGELGADGTLSVPIIDGKLYGDVTVSGSKELGEVDDIATGRDNIDDSKTWLGRARLRYAPIDSPVDIMLTAQHEDLKSHEELYIQDFRLEDRECNSAVQGCDPLLDRNVDTLSLNASYDFGSSVFTSVTWLQDREMTRIISGTRDTPEDQREIGQELRLSFGEGEDISGVIGAYFQDTAFERRDPGFAPFFGPSVNDVDNRSFALFGEATYQVTETFDVTGGLRFSLEQAEIDYLRTGAGAFAFQADDEFVDLSPKVAVGWQVAPDHRLYAVVSRGFKPGGFNHTVSNPADAIPYDSETSTNVELGWRGVLIDGALEMGAVGYWIYAEDKQIYVGPLGAQVLRNLGDAESYGAELNLRVFPTDDITLTFGGTFGHSEFVDAVDPITGANYDGNTLPYAPDLTFLAAADYVVPQNFLPGDLTLRGAVRYFSKTYFNETNTLAEGDYAIFDASVDWTMPSGFTVGLFAENITDEVYRTSSFFFGPTDVRSTLGDGRSVGIYGRYRF